MKRQKWFRIPMAAVVVVCVLVVVGMASAQAQSDDAFERVKEVQERHTEKLLAKPGVVGTAVGWDDRGWHVVLVLLEKEGLPEIPADLDGIPVRRMVTGTIHALGKPSAKSKPKAPTALVATAQSSSRIDLTWTDNASNELGFKIERKTGAGVYAQIDTTGAGVTSYSDTTGLNPSTTYTYRVRAWNNAGNSAYSNGASATTLPAPGTPPAAPTGLTATAVGSTQIDLAWTDTATNETGFKTERAPDGVSFVQIATTGTDVALYRDSGLTASTTYTYRVRAYNGTGDSDYSNVASATTDAAPEPTDPTARFPRPVPIGVSTGHPLITAGTISCRVKSGTTLYALSNNHVYAASNDAALGSAVIQPGTYDGGTSPADDIATLADFAPIIWYPFGTNTIDAAIALIMVDTVEGPAVPRVGKATPSNGYGTPNSAAAAASLNQPVQKYGRTTGLTHGTVQGLNANIIVQYDLGLYAYFTGQIMIGSSGFSAPGDSGSLVVTDDADCKPVGLLFAGSDTQTYANPIGLVLNEFGVTVDGK